MASRNTSGRSGPLTTDGTILDGGYGLPEIRRKWIWFLAFGIILLILGLVAILNLAVATIASIYYVGVLMLVGAIMEIVHAFTVKSWSSFFFFLLAGILYAIAGLFTFINPLLASVALTLFLAAALIASGAVRIWAGFKMRPGHGWGWVLGAGVVTLLAGLIVALGWPFNSLWILGMLLAVDLTFQGWSYIGFAWALKGRGSKPAPV